MSLESLNRMQREVEASVTQESYCNQAKELLAQARKAPHSLSYTLAHVVSLWRYGGDKVAREELYEVLDEMAADIYRIAEMRLAAKARFHKVQAAQKSAIVTASILPPPELEKEKEKEDS